MLTVSTTGCSLDLKSISMWIEEHQDLRNFLSSGLGFYFWVMDYLAVQQYQLSYDFAIQKVSVASVL